MIPLLKYSYVYMKCIETDMNVKMWTVVITGWGGYK